MIALRLLKRVRDFAEVNNEKTIQANTTMSALHQLGVNEQGFDDMDIRLLTLLANSAGRALGLNTISAALNEDSDTIEDVFEPYLLANGFLERTPRGRIATAKTFEALGLSFADKKTLFDME